MSINQRFLSAQGSARNAAGRRFGLGVGLAAACCALAGASAAQDLVYTPVNPSFGGNPFNSAHLLGLATAQNDYQDPRRAATSTQADAFSRQLQSRLLSALASQVTDAIFGDNPQERGRITFGGQTIEFVRGLESVVLTITNADGSVTTIEVPTFIDVT
jgi:curli production assembly/transport component CsgF